MVIASIVGTLEGIGAMKLILAVIIGVAGLVLYGFGTYDFYMTFTGNPAYLAAAGHPSAVADWLGGLEMWRRAVWGASVALGFLAALLIVVRASGGAFVAVLAPLALGGALIGYEGATGGDPSHGVTVFGVFIGLAAVLAIASIWVVQGDRR